MNKKIYFTIGALATIIAIVLDRMTGESFSYGPIAVIYMASSLLYRSHESPLCHLPAVALFAETSVSKKQGKEASNAGRSHHL
jgi:hypothetical protein